MQAIISPCGKYRYSLKRKIEGVSGDKKCLFIMLNPSTADASKDDPTIRRCMSFAKREGCSELIVENIFAFRATNPKELIGRKDIAGEKNGYYWHKSFNEVIESKGIIICGWGNNSLVTEENPPDRYAGVDLYCLGLNKNGTPKHPLYVKADAPLLLFQEGVNKGLSEPVAREPQKQGLYRDEE
jgi:hypothetical protein